MIKTSEKRKYVLFHKKTLWQFLKHDMFSQNEYTLSPESCVMKIKTGVRGVAQIED
jgi:hypothetical protein